MQVKPTHMMWIRSCNSFSLQSLPIGYPYKPFQLCHSLKPRNCGECWQNHVVLWLWKSYSEHHAHWSCVETTVRKAWTRYHITCPERLAMFLLNSSLFVFRNTTNTTSSSCHSNYFASRCVSHHASRPCTSFSIFPLFIPNSCFMSQKTPCSIW